MEKIEPDPERFEVCAHCNRIYLDLGEDGKSRTFKCRIHGTIGEWNFEAFTHWCNDFTTGQETANKNIQLELF